MDGGFRRATLFHYRRRSAGKYTAADVAPPEVECGTGFAKDLAAQPP